MKRASGAFFNEGEQGIEHSITIVEYILVHGSEEAVAQLGKRGVARRVFCDFILGRVSAAIDLNYEFAFAAEEVGRRALRASL